MNNGARFFIPTPALPKGKPTPALPKGGRKEVGTLFYKPPLTPTPALPKGGRR